MSLGFELAGFQSVFAVDVDAPAILTYRANFSAEAVCCDIRDIKDFPRARVVVGGPPCQGFSLLGKQAKKQRHENLLWRDFMRCVQQTEPDVFVIENVPEFLKDAAFLGVCKEAERLGYQLVSSVLNAADYGVPQKRKRTIIIGRLGAAPSLPPPTHIAPELALLGSELPPWRTVRDAIGDLPRIPNAWNRHDARQVSELSLQRYHYIPTQGSWKDIPDHLLPECWRNKDLSTGGSSDMMGRLPWDGQALTIRTQFLKPEKGRYLHPDAPRAITIREGARLQSFPDDFVFVGSNFQVAKQIGNAVPPLLAKAIARHVKQMILGQDSRKARGTPRQSAAG